MSLILPVRDPCRACRLYSVSFAASGLCSQCQEDFEDERKSLSEGIDWFEEYFGCKFERDESEDVDLRELERGFVSSASGSELDRQLSDELVERARLSIGDIIDSWDSENREGHE